MTDPFGVLGDPGYEAGSLLYNPWQHRRETKLLVLVPARIAQLAAGLSSRSSGSSYGASSR